MTQISQVSLQNPSPSFRSIEEGNRSEELFFHLNQICVFECSPDTKTEVQELKQKPQTWRNVHPSSPSLQPAAQLLCRVSGSCLGPGSTVSPSTHPLICSTTDSHPLPTICCLDQNRNRARGLWPLLAPTCCPPTPTCC